jgi:hypothetical protein
MTNTNNAETEETIQFNDKLTCDLNSLEDTIEFGLTSEYEQLRSAFFMLGVPSQFIMTT